MPCYLIKKSDYYNKYKNYIIVCKNFSLYLFFSLIITGFLTQALKHIIGRPRPNYTSFDAGFEFNFFNLNSEFHSFPSGHTTTIFTVAFVIFFFIPRLKFFILFLAGIVALSRVVVGAHFFTDIMGGIAISCLGIKLTKLLLDKYHPIKTIKEMGMFYNNKIGFVLIAFPFLIIFLTVGSSIDIFLSNLFYFGKGQFLLQSYYGITIFFRNIILPLLLIYIFILPIFSILLSTKQIYFNYEFKIKDIVFLWFSGFFNLLIIINLLLKNTWGRARPGDISQLDGEETFTPWYQTSSSCDVNCSFVSGDAAVGFSIIVLYFLIKKEIFFWLSLFFGFVLGTIRIMEGGHFISDIVMAGVVVFISYYFQLKVYKRYV